MNNQVLGLHHITAIASSAKRNLQFYTQILGLRLIKKTVNFDDPGSYHFYYGDQIGTPGSILTFFPWEGIGKGKNGSGMATEIVYAVPQGSLDDWQDRLKSFHAAVFPKQERFGEIYLPFEDPDGLNLSLVESKDLRKGWNKPEAIKGFDNVVISLDHLDPTARVLTELLDYQLVAQENNRFRFESLNIQQAHRLEIVIEPQSHYGRNAAGTNHHVAFRVKDDETQLALREKIASMGLNVTQQIDRDYFHSLYFREPGGVLFEIATDNPGFLIDENEEDLGKHLQLPERYEKQRKAIENILPQLLD